MSEWQWDASRNAYYVYSYEEGAYIYQDGTRIRVQQTDLAAATNEGDRSQDVSTRPRTHQRTSVSDLSTTTHSRSISSGDYITEDQLSKRFTNLSLATDQDWSSYEQQDVMRSLYTAPVHYGAQQQSPGSQASHSAASRPYNYTRRASTHSTSSADYSTIPTSAYGHPAYEQSYAAESSAQGAQRGDQLPNSSLGVVYRSPKYPAEKLTTDQELFQQGLYAQAMVRGPQYGGERLDPGYILRSENFFKVGKVIKVLWPEPAGDSASFTTQKTRYGERIYVKVRYFVIAKEGKNFSTCVPIHTYTGRGATKSHIVIWHHGIVFSGEVPPKPLPAEENMAMPVRVTRKNKQAPRLEEMSRINYGKLYTVEHNLRIYDWGNVHKDHVKIFLSNFWDVLSRDLRQRIISFPPAPLHQVQEEGGEESEDDGEQEAGDDDDV